MTQLLSLTQSGHSWKQKAGRFWGSARTAFSPEAFFAAHGSKANAGKPLNG
jgi:hypothetical protein